MRFKVFPWTLVSLAFIIDQISKQYILRIAENLPQELFPFLTITLVKNRGISFGFLNHQSPLIFGVLTLIIMLLIFYVGYMLYNTKKKDSMWGLSLVLGGALGNLLDRFLFGGVIDFIDFHIATYHWPAFNFADSFIFIGVALLLRSSFKESK